MNDRHEYPDHPETNSNIRQSVTKPVSSQSEQHQNTNASNRQNFSAQENADRWAAMLEAWFFEQFGKATLLDIAGILVNVVLVAIGTAAACIYDGQLREMRHTNELTQKALDYTKEQNAAQSVIDAESRKKSEEQASKSLDATIDNFRQDQRAWVGLCESQMANFTKGQNIRIDLKFCNSGKTPAKHVEESVSYVLEDANSKAEVPTAEMIHNLQYWPSHSIAPQSYSVINGGLKGVIKPTEIQDNGQWGLDLRFDDIANKSVVLYYFGMMKYQDNWGKVHHAQFCLYLADPTTKTLAHCSKFNEID